MRVRPITTVGVLALGLGVLGGTPAFAADSGVTTTDDTTTCSTGACSLRGAIIAANADGGGTITLSPNATYTLGLADANEDGGRTGDLDITSPITLVGNGATIDGAGLDRVIDVLAGGSLTASNLTITGGSTANAPSGLATASGAGIRTVGDVTLTSVSLDGNKALGAMASGGGLYNDGATVTLVNSAARNNTAVRAGGGIEVSTGTTVLDRTTLDSNTAGPTPGNGGGLHVSGAADTTVTGSVVTGNTAASEGGGLWNSATGTMLVTQSRVQGNTAQAATVAVAPNTPNSQGGGGIFSDGGETTVRFSDVSGNTATGVGASGGGIQSFGPLTVELSVLYNNTSVRAGGAIEANGSDTTIRFSGLSFNSTGPTPGNGGAFHLTGDGTTTVDGVVAFANNAATEGGGFWNSATGTMTIDRSYVAFNNAPDGPNVYNDGGTLTFNGADIPDESGV